MITAMPWVAIGALALALLVGVVWVIPAAMGPYSVDCGELEPMACERVWRQVADENDDGILAFVPVTGVRVEPGASEPPACGGSVHTERWLFGVIVNHVCL
jgi:hypothetical protein